MNKLFKSSFSLFIFHSLWEVRIHATLFLLRPLPDEQIFYRNSARQAWLVRQNADSARRVRSESSAARKVAGAHVVFPSVADEIVAYRYVQRGIDYRSAGISVGINPTVDILADNGYGVALVAEEVLQVVDLYKLIAELVVEREQITVYARARRVLLCAEEYADIRGVRVDIAQFYRKVEVIFVEAVENRKRNVADRNAAACRFRNVFGSFRRTVFSRGNAVDRRIRCDAQRLAACAA